MTIPSLISTEAFAESLNRLDELERDATGASLGPLVPEIAFHLALVGVLDKSALTSPELTALTAPEVTTNPGMVIRILGVDDLDVWPRGV